MTAGPYTILIGGKAGEGVKKAAQVIAGLMCAHGFHVCQADDYQSLIKGGHNFSIVTASSEEIYCAHQCPDLLICFDKMSVEMHASKLNPGGMLFYNSDELGPEAGTGIPMSTLMKRHYSGPANVSMAAIAIFMAVAGLDIDALTRLIRTQYKRDLTENLSYAKEVYDLVSIQSGFALGPERSSPARLTSGNQAMILGAWKAGLDMYFGYPMTPASSLLHYAALKQDSLGIQAIHAESELAAINMALGAALAGCRVAVGSSGGGFALMQEAFSAAGMVEAPLLCFLSSRPGPATGVSTYTAQEDLFFALNQGHGEFFRIVASPDSIERAFYLAAELLSLAWKFQIPVILLTEKQLSEGMADIVITETAVPSADPVDAESGPSYQRYQITADGVSPLCFPGAGQAPETVIKWSTHEHLASGLRTDKASEIVAMKDKRGRKGEHIRAACDRFQTVAEYGEGETIVFAYGSTVLELREALKYSTIPFRIVAPIYLEPFPEERLAAYKRARVIVVEHSSAEQFARLLKWKLEVEVAKCINRYDGRPFDPIELGALICEASNA